MHIKQNIFETQLRDITFYENYTPLHNHNINEFLLYLDMWYGVPMDQETLGSFRINFTFLYQKAYDKRIQDRVDRSYGIYIVNNIFNELNINRELIKYNDKWYLLQV